MIRYVRWKTSLRLTHIFCCVIYSSIYKYILYLNLSFNMCKKRTLLLIYLLRTKNPLSIASKLLQKTIWIPFRQTNIHSVNNPILFKLVLEKCSTWNILVVVFCNGLFCTTDKNRFELLFQNITLRRVFLFYTQLLP